MFDLITDDDNRALRERSIASKIVAIVGHGLVILTVIAIPLFNVTTELPRVVPTIMAFVAAQPATPPPPPPPPPPPAAVGAKPAPKSARTTGDFAAPLESPKGIQVERDETRDEASGGVVGGVEGGVPGGVIGGVVGGIVSPAPPPPAPPPPLVARGPVRIGGQITAPALLHRVEPVYPDVAAMAHLGGIVILEATVGTDGCVESVRVLRSRHPLLDKASQEALIQWKYSPLMLNGTPAAFILTVTFSFAFK